MFNWSKNNIWIVTIIFCLLFVGCSNKVEKQSDNLLDTSTKEYMERVAHIVNLSYSGDEMFQHKSLYTTEFPYMRFKIICKHEREEDFDKATREIAEKVFYELKKYDYKSPFAKVTYEIINLEFESEKRDKISGVLNYVELYSFNVDYLEKHDTFEEFFKYRFE